MVRLQVQLQGIGSERGEQPPTQIKMVSNTSFHSPQFHLEWVLPATDRHWVNILAKSPVVQAAVVAILPSKWSVPICGRHWKIPNASFQLMLAVGQLLLG